MAGNLTRMKLLGVVLLASLAGAAAAQPAPAPTQPAPTTTVVAPVAVPAPAPAPVTQPPVVVPVQPAPVTVLPVTNTAATPVPQPPLPQRPLSDSYVKWMIFALGVIGLVALLIIYTTLRNSGKWSLADALSEEGTVTVLNPDGSPVLDKDGKPLTMTRLVASTSRLIALMGLFGILLLYCGFGAAVLYYFATGQVLPPQTDDVRSFLYAGLTLFAPYIVSKFTSVFSGPGAVRQ